MSAVRATFDGRPDDVGFFDPLADEMNAHAERYEILGDLDLVLGIVMTRPAGDRFRARLAFEGVRCTGVSAMAAGEEATTDCWLEGSLDAWDAMFADIVAHGHATGRHTINSLTMMGDEIRLCGVDVMGVDKFSRFNQSLQEFFDGAARVSSASASA